MALSLPRSMAMCPLLLGLGVVERRGIAVEGHYSVVQRRGSRTTAAQKLNSRLLDDCLVARRMGIHALTDYCLGRHLIETQHLGKVDIFPEPIDGFEVALAQTQQRDIARQHTRVGHGIAWQWRYRLGTHG
jgi:hypothetical protein